MNPLFDTAPESGVTNSKTYYDLLGVESSAPKILIHEAYLKAKSIYAKKNHALYSMVDDSKLNKMRADIETAFRVLKDDLRRAAYDRELAGESADNNERVGAVAAGGQISTVSVVKASQAVGLSAETKEKVKQLFDELELGRGDSLRRLREGAGFSLETLKLETRIPEDSIKALENEDFAALPAYIYAKGYIHNYLKCLSLDSKEFIEQFTVHYKEYLNNKGL
jgi:curved DNA-binding protein CbpA